MVRLGGARRLGLIAAVAAALWAAALSACGGADESASRSATPGQPGAGGVLTWALEARPLDIDPLAADTRGEQLVSRQIHEPLIANLVGPYGAIRRESGLALSARPTAGDTIWRMRLRTGVRFQDGSAFNAGTVVANGQRWLTTPEGQALMPDLFAVDAPRPDVVRFFLEQPNPEFPEVLVSPRAGIVSPRALAPASGTEAVMRSESRSGTGPFELREEDASGVLLARNLEWWGTERELGPAFDQVDFRIISNASERVALLGEGDVQVAEALGPAQVREARADPLLQVLPGPAESLGLERSVRGISSATEVPSLSGVWVTRVGSGPA